MKTGSLGGRFGTLFTAELKLALKGLPIWWYAGAIGFIVFGALAGDDVGREWVLPFAWIWPVLVWSKMGVRESENHMEALVLTAPRPLSRQLPAIFLTGLLIAVILGSGVLARLVIAGDMSAVASWVATATFIPAAAIALGTWGQSARLFQMVYLSVWYAGPMQGVGLFDFIGLKPDIPVDTNRVLTVVGVTAVLIVIGIAGRARQIRY